jgi:hypothetical protein
MSTVYAESEPADGGRYVNTTGADLIQDQFTVMGGKALRACEAIASLATGAFEKLVGHIVQCADFVTGEATFASAGLAVYWNPVDGKFSNTATTGYYLIGYTLGAIASGVLRVEVIQPVLVDTDVTALALVVDGITDPAGILIAKTATLTAAAAATPVHVITDAQVGSKTFHLIAAFLKVDGATGWTDSTGTVVTVQDTNGTPVVGLTYAKAQLTGNAKLVLGSTGLTIGDAVIEGTGFTAAKGLDIVADSNFDAGDNIKVTLVGYLA